MKPKLVLYWEGSLNPIIETNITKWRDLNLDFDVLIYNRITASNYIQKNYNSQILNCFLNCNPPAMQSDFFRLCALANESHVFYADCNFKPLNPILSVIPLKENTGMLCRKTWIKTGESWIINGFAGNFGNKKIKSMFLMMLEIACLNIKNKTSNNVWEVTGPGIWNMIYNKLDNFGDTILIFELWNGELTLKNTLIELGKIKETNENHWSVFQKSNSIFND